MKTENGPFGAFACSPEAKPDPSGAAGNTMHQDRLKSLQKEVVRPELELEAESQNGNPGPFVSKSSQ